MQTRLISAEGLDDSMPRAALVFGVPGLLCLLCLVCHAQLWLHQKAEKLPPTPVRLLGRWTSLAAAESGWTLRNCGVSGDTTGGMLVRLRELMSGLDGRSDERCFLLLGGCNDISLGEKRSPATPSISAAAGSCITAPCCSTPT